MAAISAKDVSALRAKTGCGMMDCKKALSEANGNMDEAIKLLRERGLAVAAKKADRIAAEGIVDIAFDATGKKAAMIEVNCETDFVAKNADFRAFVKTVLDVILANNPADVEALKALPFPGTNMNVEGALKDKIFQIGENLSIRRFMVTEGVLSSYIHGNGVTGVIIKFEADEAAASNAGFAEYAKNIALQVAAMPVQYVNKEDVPQSVLDEEKQILMTQIKSDEKNAKKPDAIIEKMVAGKIGKFYENNCLIEQAYVKDDSMSVGKYTEATAKEFGGSIKIVNFFRYEKGEGIQKREDNFAEEIAQLVKG
ncbi:MAG: elongation factor Ts [Ruminococcaceae bacterium]|nr:elongation factor Ts [Oscillospiraceae bacterium]